MTDRTDRVALFLLCTLSVLLVFPNLGTVCLWQDEGQTAVVAKNVLSSGLPKASDGRNFVSIFPDHRDVRSGLYIWQPWLPVYLSAGSMAVFGSNAFAARFPFAAAFVVLTGAGYLVFRKWSGDRTHALAAAVLMAGCAALLLHSRQCRYYVLVPLFQLLIADAYLDVSAAPSARASFRLCAWCCALFHTFYPAVALMTTAIGMDLAVRRVPRNVWYHVLSALALVAVLNLPAAFFFRIWDRSFGAQAGYSGVDIFGMYLVRYLLTVNHFFFPFLLLIPAAAVGWFRGRKPAPEARRRLRFLLLLCAVQLIGYTLLSPYPFTRYLVGIAPFILFLGAWSLRSLAGAQSWPVWTLVAVVATTNALSTIPLYPAKELLFEGVKWEKGGVAGGYLDPQRIGYSYARGEVRMLLEEKTGSPLVRYAAALFRPASGPVDEIVSVLKTGAAPDDRVKIAYGDLPLMFHTDLRVVSASVVGPPAPEWIIPRAFNPLNTDREFIRQTPKSRYEPMQLPVADRQWNNRPDPLYHYYAPPDQTDIPDLVVYRKHP